MSATKFCTGCQTEKPVSQFNKNKGRKDGLNGHCKDCFKAWIDQNKDRVLENGRKYKQANKEEIKAKRPAYHAKKRVHIRKNLRQRRLMVRYGITEEEYRLMIGLQEGCCAICRVQFDFIGVNKGNKPEIDHCHATNKIRGILCGNCNRALGLFKDDVDALQEAINYLKI